MAEPDVLEAPNILEYPYARSVGPIIGRFMAGLRDRRFLGIRAKDGHVICPPTEYDPETGEELTVDRLVEVGPNGEVTTWAWVAHPHEKHPLDRPFAWALIGLDGADTALLHVVDAGDESRMRTGMRVKPRWREERVGDIHDVEAFVPEDQ
ncbi:MAG TPA: OB-fold domain-containing protein [Agromyces sp.]|nr:OB-fold domain-containing protein [Agromyces sp.]